MPSCDICSSTHAPMVCLMALPVSLREPVTDTSRLKNLQAMWCSPVSAATPSAWKTRDQLVCAHLCACNNKCSMSLIHADIFYMFQCFVFVVQCMGAECGRVVQMIGWCRSLRWEGMEVVWVRNGALPSDTVLRFRNCDAHKVSLYATSVDVLFSWSTSLRMALFYTELCSNRLHGAAIGAQFSCTLSSSVYRGSLGWGTTPLYKKSSHTWPKGAQRGGPPHRV